MHQYNQPAAGVPSTVGAFAGAGQMRDFVYEKKALIDAMPNMYFSPMADTRTMPKHMGKKIKQYHYLPLLDDRNVNDQGIDATGASISAGNLYGSSRDIGSIPSKMPVLSETGGRVNRVGFQRKELEGTLEKFGFFTEYTQEALDFDSDAELLMHINREMVNGATQICEALLQIDIINFAGVVRYPGAATSRATVATDTITYRDLLRLHLELSDNRTPLKTKVISGTRMIDTVTVAGGRVIMIGHELQPTIEAMLDLHGKPAFEPVHKYAAGATIMNGEIGSVGYFRFIVVPEMFHWAGVGTAHDGSTHYATDGQLDVFPMLCIGEASFTTIGFQTDGKSSKFKIIHKKPGTKAADRQDPYGERGFMSIKFWYGFFGQRAERIALLYSAAEL